MINKEASEATGLTCHGGQLKGRVVESTTAIAGLTSFLDFLTPLKSCILVAHNFRAFDCKILVNHLQQNNLMSRFKNICLGFSDSLTMFRELYPQRKKTETVIQTKRSLQRSTEI